MVPDVPVLKQNVEPSNVDLKEKPTEGCDMEIINEKAGSSYGLGSDSSVELGSDLDREDVRLVDGEPVITSGADVSKYLITTRDDGDPAITMRSVVLGTVFAALGAAMFVTAWGMGWKSVKAKPKQPDPKAEIVPEVVEEATIESEV